LMMLLPNPRRLKGTAADIFRDYHFHALAG